MLIETAKACIASGSALRVLQCVVMVDKATQLVDTTVNMMARPVNRGVRGVAVQAAADALLLNIYIHVNRYDALWFRPNSTEKVRLAKVTIADSVHNMHVILDGEHVDLVLNQKYVMIDTVVGGWQNLRTELG